MTKGLPLQDAFLEALCTEKIATSVYLVNGIKLQGQVESFNEEIVMLKSHVTQMIYKHAISTIVPAHRLDYGTEEEESA